ncbi:MAG: site-specific integrase [Bacteroidota bacterium]
MASIKFFLKDAKSSEPTLIYLFIMAGNERFKVSTTKKILPLHWDHQKQQAKKGHSGYAELNIFLNTIAVEADKTYNRFLSAREPFSLDDVKKTIRLRDTLKPVERKETFLNFIEEFIQRNIQLKTALTIKSYRNTRNHLVAFREWGGANSLAFDQIDLIFYDKFTAYLFNEKRLSNNSVSNQIKNLKVFLNEATELGLNKNLDFKKKRFKKMEQDSDSVYLNESEIETIFKLDLRDKPSLDRVRDLFIVGCWTGLRFGDFTALSKDNIDKEMITIRTRKTDNPVMIPIHPMVRKIFKKYTVNNDIILPNTISNQKMNDYLKEVAKLACLNETVIITIARGTVKEKQTYPKHELVTSHCARRSFATNLYLQGFPAISIMKITGHKTEKAFLKYIKISQEENARKLMEFWKGMRSER